ncbi:carbon storage regulator CsrA [Bacillaceae bacterium CLA-AA-H227]|uniref:Carbon storage regulator CsrA n=1 Tax=Robertmurraya yapensis (ex Hitch et al 2024) TaxID=3133160 RepID=A0ACC6SEM7_9BACI
MLVLTRKKGESVVIGDQIVVEIVEIDGDQIRLGITAPKNIQIHRAEIYQAIQEENKEALTVSENFIKNIKKNSK